MQMSIAPTPFSLSLSPSVCFCFFALVVVFLVTMVLGGPSGHSDFCCLDVSDSHGCTVIVGSPGGISDLREFTLYKKCIF